MLDFPRFCASETKNGPDYNSSGEVSNNIAQAKAWCERNRDYSKNQVNNNVSRKVSQKSKIYVSKQPNPFWLINADLALNVRNGWLTKKGAVYKFLKC